MAAEVNRQVRLKARPDGIPQAAHFEIVESAVSPIGEGQFLVRNRFLSVEPATRAFFAAERSEWDPGTLLERSFDLERAKQHFEETNTRYGLA